MAVMFTLAGVLGVATALLALNSRSYKELSAAYRSQSHSHQG